MRNDDHQGRFFYTLKDTYSIEVEIRIDLGGNLKILSGNVLAILSFEIGEQVI